MDGNFSRMGDNFVVGINVRRPEVDQNVDNEHHIDLVHPNEMKDKKKG